MVQRMTEEPGIPADLAIRVEDLGKCHRIYERPQDRLKQALWRGRRRYFRDFWAVRHVSFELPRGETLGIIGRNGSGKSTLLQMICGVLTPSEGHARCRGRLAALLELGSGFNPDFTGIENVFMNAALLGMGQRETEAKLDAILAFADIGEFARQPTKTYSSGMAVRLAFAVCAHSDPGLLIADEALAVGDELFQAKCYRHLEKLRENGCSILLVSHNPADHVKHCSRSLWLEAGQVMEEGLPKQVVNHYQRHLYTGSLEVPDQPVPESSEESGKASGDGAAPADATASFQAGLSEAFPEWYLARQGVEILSIDCFDAQQRQANCFRPHSGFMLRMRARTSCDLRGLYFACHLRDGSGVEICGLRSAEIEVEANREIRIDFPFAAHMRPGIYTFGGGAWSEMVEGRNLHRGLNVGALRILEEAGDATFGLCDLSAGAPTIAVEPGTAEGATP
jgi:lipopolysaccharide transport system ATP-binding protein